MGGGRWISQGNADADRRRRALSNIILLARPVGFELPSHALLPSPVPGNEQRVSYHGSIMTISTSARTERPAVRIALLALLVVLPAARTASAAAQDDPTPVRRAALLVGIGDYPDEQLGDSDLPGAPNDLELVTAVLTERFGFRESEILILADGDATHEAIVTAFHRHLIQPADESTEVVFWYSGHGSRVPDASGRRLAEDSDMDSTLVAWDSRLDGRRGSFDLADDELSSLLAALTARTGRVTMVTDSCHSGGVTRGLAGRGVRTIPIGDQPLDRQLLRPFWPAEIELLDDDQSGPDTGRYVHIAACGPTQLAREWIPDSNGRAYGALTWFLSLRLRSSQPRETYRGITSSVSRWIAGRVPGQSVHCMGALERVLFDGDFESRPTGFPAHIRPGTSREIEIEAGRLHGLQLGSAVQLRDIAGAEVGRAMVRRLGAASSAALLDGFGDAGLTELPMWATEVERPGERQKLAVLVPHHRLGEELTRRYGERVEVVRGDGEQWLHRLEVVPADATPEQPASVRFVGPDGVRIWPGVSSERAGDDWLERAVEKFDVLADKERQYQAALELAQVRGALTVEPRFGRLAPAELRGPTTGGNWPQPMSDGGVRPLGAAGAERGGARSFDFTAKIPTDPERRPLARLDIRNPLDVDLHVAVLSVTEAREISVLAPREGETHWIPAGGTSSVYAVLESDPELGLDRPMRDRYLVIATRETADFHSLIMQGSLRSASPESDAMPGLIRQALSARTLRGGTSTAETESFGIVAIDLLVGTE